MENQTITTKYCGLTKRCALEELCVLDHITSYLWFKDINNNILFANNSAARLIEKNKDDIKNVSCWDIFPKTIADSYYKDDQYVIKTKQPKLGIIEEITSSSHKKYWQGSERPRARVREDNRRPSKAIPPRV